MSPLPPTEAVTEQWEQRATPGPRPALSAHERVLAVWEYHLRVYRRTWRGSVISRALMPLLFLLSMGVGLGSLVDHRAGGVHGVPYLAFVAPAILAVQTMWVANGESTYQVLGYIKWNMTYHAQLASPLGVRDVLSGHFLAVACHLVMSTSFFMVVAALFGGFHSWWALLCLPIAVLTGMAFSIPMFAFTAVQEGDNGFNILFRWIITPMMLFSGTFFPIQQLPVWMQPIAWATPLWHGVEACRAVASGTIAWGPLAGHLLVPLAYAAVGWWLAERAFARRLVP
ncbi:ABC transporter permease [Nostocoides sp. HKS02]|uniref:ABC transporter permease n=1 Tax=Nostocoides sp. HKS02 TaxID=1813880 RepID=UPI0012B465C1|nr:ABC transporter permease [Tetrasphaera sp. HKS02]QGN56937.1 ABC transporter [Tetrasphaera sp. HKS02]